MKQEINSPNRCKLFFHFEKNKIVIDRYIERLFSTKIVLTNDEALIAQ